MKRLLCSFSCFICIFMFAACNMTSKFFSKIEEMYCIQWIDENNDIVLRQAINYGWGYGTVTVDGVNYPICFSFQDPNVPTSADCVINLETADETFSDAENWIMVKADDSGNPTILRSIEPSTIFGREYRDIVLKKQTLEVTEFDAIEFCLNTRWTSAKFSFSMGGCDVNGSYSKAFILETQGGNREVRFEWLLNKTFQICDWNDHSVLAAGNYENEGLNAVLHFTKNELWDEIDDMYLLGEFLF